MSRNEKLGPLAPGQRRTVARKREAVLRLLRGFIPPEKLKHSEWRAQTAPRGRIPESAPGGQDEASSGPKQGRARYKLRQTSVEPVFGHIKEPMGFRQVPLRGQDKAGRPARLLPWSEPLEISR